MKDEEILDKFKKINDNLKKYFLCIPPYNSINNSFIEKASELRENKLITNLITTEIIDCGRRAYQMVCRYRELEIFNTEILECNYIKKNYQLTTQTNG